MHEHEASPLFVLVQGGEVYSWSYSEEDVLGEAKEHVYQYISDFLRHQLPLQVTPEIANRLDIRLYQLDTTRTPRVDLSRQIALPFQAWFDENYQERQNYEREEEDREYRQFIELRAKYEDRYQQECLPEKRS